MSKRYADIGGRDRQQGYMGRVNDYCDEMESSETVSKPRGRDVFHTDRRWHATEDGYTVCLGVPVHGNRKYSRGAGGMPPCKNCQKIMAKALAQAREASGGDDLLLIYHPDDYLTLLWQNPAFPDDLGDDVTHLGYGTTRRAAVEDLLEPQR